MKTAIMSVVVLCGIVLCEIERESEIPEPGQLRPALERSFNKVKEFVKKLLEPGSHHHHHRRRHNHHRHRHHGSANRTEEKGTVHNEKLGVLVQRVSLLDVSNVTDKEVFDAVTELVPGVKMEDIGIFMVMCPRYVEILARPNTPVEEPEFELLQ